MGRSKELSDFQRGTVVGCHLSNKSVRETSALLDLPRSTVSSVIVKWKRLGQTTAQPRSGRPRKLTGRDLRVLSRVVRKNRRSSVATLTAEVRNATGSDVSARTVRRELHELGFYCRTGAAKITMRTAEGRPANADNISLEDLKALLGKSQSLLLVDVRSKEEVDKGCIPGSIHIPVDAVESALALDPAEFKAKYGVTKPPPDAPELVFHCQMGRRAKVATDKAHEMGFQNARNYAGGFKEWSEKDGE